MLARLTDQNQRPGGTNEQKRERLAKEREEATERADGEERIYYEEPEVSTAETVEAVAEKVRRLLCSRRFLCLFSRRVRGSLSEEEAISRSPSPVHATGHGVAFGRWRPPLRGAGGASRAKGFRSIPRNP